MTPLAETPMVFKGPSGTVFVFEGPWIVVRRPGKPNYRVPYQDMHHFGDFLSAMNAAAQDDGSSLND